MKQVDRQHLGGVASLSGNDFESHFAVWRVLLALERARLGEPARHAQQLRACHVDDWAERDADSRYLQLRRRRQQNWGQVREAFISQLAVGKSASVTWVVASTALALRLRRARGRLPKVDILQFPGWLEPARHVAAGPTHAALRAACVVNAPSTSDLELLWKDVSYAWLNTRRLGSFIPIGRVLAHLDDDGATPLRVAGSSHADGEVRQRSSPGSPTSTVVSRTATSSTPTALASTAECPVEVVNSASLLAVWCNDDLDSQAKSWSFCERN